MKKPINLALAIYIAIILSVTLLTMGCEAEEEIIQVQADTSLNKIEWIGFFNYYGVTDQGWIQRRKKGLTMSFNHDNNKVMLESLSYSPSWTTSTTYQIEDQDNNIFSLSLNSGANNFECQVPGTATHVRFLHEQGDVFNTTPYIEIKNSYINFIAYFNGNTKYSN